MGELCPWDVSASFIAGAGLPVHSVGEGEGCIARHILSAPYRPWDLRPSEVVNRGRCTVPKILGSIARQRDIGPEFGLLSCAVWG